MVCLNKNNGVRITSACLMVSMYYSDLKFKPTDAFIGIQKDTPASVIFQASNLLKLATAAVRAGVDVAGGKWERILQWSNVERSSWTIEEEQDHETWIKAVSVTASFLITVSIFIIAWQVLFLSKYFLLQTASPDAIVRLEHTALAADSGLLKCIYFERQHHESIDDFLHYHVHDGQREGLLMQVLGIEYMI